EIGGTNTWDQANGIAKQQLMSAEEIGYWADRGIEFGAHSSTHPNMCCKEPFNVEAEMLESREALSKIVKRPILAFAYPYGCYNDSVIERARGAFSIAFTTAPGMND